MSTMKRDVVHWKKQNQGCMDYDDTGSYCSDDRGGLSDTSYILAESP